MELDTRYLKLAGLTLLIALVIYIALLIIFMFLPLSLPQFYHVTVSLMAAGYLVYKYFAGGIA